MRADHSYLLDEHALAQVLHGPKRLQHVHTYSIHFAKGEVHQAADHWDFDPKDRALIELLRAAHGRVLVHGWLLGTHEAELVARGLIRRLM